METIAINDDTLWSGSEHFTPNTKYFDTMQEVRKLLEKGKLSEANRLLEEKIEWKVVRGVSSDGKFTFDYRNGR